MKLIQRLQFKKFRMYTLAVVSYVIIASLIVVPYINHRRTVTKVHAQLAQYLKEAQHSASITSPNLATPIFNGVPTNISIDRLNIHLPVAPGFYNTSSRKWTLDSKHVFTDNLTDSDPIVSTRQANALALYGHDIPGILVKTSDLIFGDILRIDTTNGYEFRYYYDKDQVVVPTDTAILHTKNTGDPIMLITCTGTWYQFRHVMFFRLLDAFKLPASPLKGTST